MALGRKVLVLLDSDHRQAHVVLKELQSCSDIVPAGGYTIIQGTNISGYTIRYLEFSGDVPMEAVKAFLSTHPNSYQTRHGGNCPLLCIRTDS
jgi:cephalosporin hydroxylase